MLRVAFEPPIPVFKGVKTVHALDGAATVALTKTVHVYSSNRGKPISTFCGQNVGFFFNVETGGTTVLWRSSFQPAVRVLLGVFEDILGGTRKHLAGYVKIEKKNIIL
jgi:hypothetical protein